MLLYFYFVFEKDLSTVAENNAFYFFAYLMNNLKSPCFLFTYSVTTILYNGYSQETEDNCREY